MRPPIDQGVVLVTGASSGIGLAMAEQLAPRAKVLVLVARRRERLEALREKLIAKHPALTVDVQACDLADRAAVDAMLTDVEARTGGIDVLINNAGFGDLGVFDLLSWEKTERMIDLNVTTLTYLTHRLVRPMVARGRGGVLNISSGYGLTFMPGLTAYIATKHYVTGFTEALRLDLTGTGVVITQSCPGPVKTEFMEGLGNFTGQDVPGFIEISAEKCARQTLRGFDRGRALVMPGFWIQLATILGMHTPRVLLRAIYAPIARALRKKQLAAGSAPKGS